MFFIKRKGTADGLCAGRTCGDARSGANSLALQQGIERSRLSNSTRGSPKERITGRRLIGGPTGAIGAILGVRLLEVRNETDVDSHLVISNWARRAIEWPDEAVVPMLELRTAGQWIPSSCMTSIAIRCASIEAGIPAYKVSKMKTSRRGHSGAP